MDAAAAPGSDAWSSAARMRVLTDEFDVEVPTRMPEHVPLPVTFDVETGRRLREELAECSQVDVEGLPGRLRWTAHPDQLRELFERLAAFAREQCHQDPPRPTGDDHFAVLPGSGRAD